MFIIAILAVLCAILLIALILKDVFNPAEKVDKKNDSEYAKEIVDRMIVKPKDEKDESEE